MTVQLIRGDCLDVLPTLEANSVDSIVTDPPYGLGFMGKDWDGGVPGVHFWEAALRVAKPGAMLMAFGGTRTWHRLACAIEDAGWEIRDTVMWVYGSGFPKSHDISKAIDKAAGAEREVVGRHNGSGMTKQNKIQGCNPRNVMEWNVYSDTPATDAAAEWDGWGTALKPAWEPIIVAMKPLDGTYAANALRWGCAGLWVDGGRIQTSDGLRGGGCTGSVSERQEGWDRPWKHDAAKVAAHAEKRTANAEHAEKIGRWPANLILDGEAGRLLDAQSGESTSTQSWRGERAGNIYGGGRGPSGPDTLRGHSDSGGASRFFQRCDWDEADVRFCYQAKASRKERDMGLEGFEERVRLRDDLTPEQREWVMAELERCGVRL